MAHVVVNGVCTRPSGATQVLAGLLSRLSATHRYTVLMNDPRSVEVTRGIVGDRDHIQYVDPVGRPGNGAGYLWNMTRYGRWLRVHGADCVLGVNHFYPASGLPQITYHMNVLRFERPRRALWQSGEVADRLRDWLATRAVRRADVNLFESQLLFDLARQRHSQIRNGQVLYIGIEDRETQASPNPDPDPTLLAITSHQPHKDNETLIRMLAVLVRLRPEVPWRLAIAGGRTPEVFDPLRALAAEVGVADRVDFLGFCTHQQLSGIGARSLCLVSASLAESFCMVALEAMSWGCPAVVADISAMPESVGDAGLLARPSDPEDFARQVLRLWEDGDLRADLVTKGHERAASMTWAAAAAEVERQIDQLCSARISS